jgi:peptide-methionine (S)-S-oxide reductase
LDIFWLSHDPTTLNRQGNDIGEQYRSIILYANDDQKSQAETSLQAVNGSGQYPQMAVTIIQPLEEFYLAEEYHQDYFAKNPDQPYCRMVISPKLSHFMEIYKS